MPHVESSQLTRVTIKSYPIVFSAFRLIDYDNGAVNQYELERAEYMVPDPYSSLLLVAEVALFLLSAADFKDFCVGEQSDYADEPNPGFNAAHRLLNAYSEGFPDTESDQQ